MRRVRRRSTISFALLLFAACGETAGGSDPPPVADARLLPDAAFVVDAFEAGDAACLPHPELCNGIDDDCDGLVDDGDPDIDRATFDDVNNCGACGTSCDAERAEQTTCRSGACEIAACAPGFSDYNGEFTDGCESDCLVSAGGREVCDQTDNDCDGETDEEFDLTGDPENCGDCGVECEARPNATVVCKASTCALEGCASGFVDADHRAENGCEYRCTARSTERVREFCNGLDDDCDGLIDEPEDVAPPEEDFCGLNGVCAFECGVDDDCGDPARRCNEGHVCVPADGAPGTLDCAVDADCQALDPGLACVGTLTLGPDGPVTIRRCVERRHEPVCDGLAGYRCVRPPAYINGTELGACDGVDNNCNGQVDEDFVNALFVDGARREEPRTCTAGEGACAQGGRIRCTADGTATECSATALPPPMPVDDDCNGLDDDCDGRIDEEYEDAFIVAGAVRVYAYEASRPGATGAAPGVDLVPDDGRDAYVEARACARRGVLPWANVTWAEATAACEAAGARLCRRDEWTRACGGGEPYPYGADYQGQSCNGGAFDTDPGTGGDQDAVLATGALATCQRAGAFDLSGNLKEWTDDLIDGLRPIRGGGTESNVPGGLTCDGLGDLKPEAFRSATLGFRCCREL